MTAFIFQPQNIVANPNVVFYKADTHEHREKLRTIFPYVLGAISPLTLAKQHELSRVRTELRRKERELIAIREVSERWVADAKSKISTAREFGLITHVPADDAPVSELVQALRGIAVDISEPNVSAGTISAAITELQGLNREERELSLALSQSRRRYADMRGLRDASGEYGEALGIKRDRLKIAEWLSSLYESNGDCLLCGSNQRPHAVLLSELSDALAETQEQAGAFHRVPAAFDREFERIASELAHVAEKLEGVRVRRKVLEARSAVAERESYSRFATAKFIGALQEALVRFDSIAQDGDLNSEVLELRSQVEQLEADLRRLDINNAIRRAVDALTVFMARTVPQLDVERPDDPVVLAIDDLSIKVSGTERQDYLWEMGSGANWVGYHVALTLALQNLFMGLRHSTVPSFIVYDQPSQVYFPKKLAQKRRLLDVDDSPEPRLDDEEDVRAVRKIFALIGAETRRHGGKLQTIVLDHAAEDVWSSVEGIHLVEEWRGGSKLVPTSWYADL